MSHTYSKKKTKKLTTQKEQIEDSIDIQSSLFSFLWAPLNSNLHKLHHKHPQIPYHNLRKVENMKEYNYKSLTQAMFNFLQKEKDIFEFVSSKEDDFHTTRRKEILKKYPEVKKLFGRNPWTSVFILITVITQMGLAFLISDSSFLYQFLLAFCVGAFLSHNCFVLIHECGHNLVFRKVFWNNIFCLIANIPLLAPTAIAFKKYHSLHHSKLHRIGVDADLPPLWEAKLVGNSSFKKALWLLFFPIFYAIRSSSVTKIKLICPWVIANIASQVLALGLILGLGYSNILPYLLMSFFFAIGLHPLGGRWMQEHFHVNDCEQHTNSYYGIGNLVTFNVGYHNEHHDIPHIPWSRIKEYRRITSNFYDNLKPVKSWTGLVMDFIFNPKMSLFSRYKVEEEKKNVANW